MKRGNEEEREGRSTTYITIGIFLAFLSALLVTITITGVGFEGALFKAESFANGVKELDLWLE